ncbi:MAG: hypothetical protein IPK83_19130 [Planctomycetes bacterium]|nr:hypothetical protein [Planctomycetota bacterium]
MMTNHKDSGLIDDLIYADRWALLNDPVGCAAREAVASGVVDPLVRELIGEPVRRHKIAQAFAGPFPLPRLCHGNLVLGTDVNGRPVRVPVHYLNGHSITVGNSGSGKTTRSHFMTLQVAPMVRGVWLFDFRKREFRILRPLLARMGVDSSSCPRENYESTRFRCLRVSIPQTGLRERLI